MLPRLSETVALGEGNLDDKLTRLFSLNENITKDRSVMNDFMNCTVGEIKFSELISVIIPVYNTAPYLERCLKSVLENTYRDLQVICINDGSTDESLTILKEFEKQDSRIQVVEQEKSGVSKARNKGLSLAKGEYIAFLDSDDWVHHQYFELLLNGLKRYEADVAVCMEKRTKEFQNEMEISLDQIMVTELDIRQCVEISMVKNYVWGRLYRKVMLHGIAFQEGHSLGEDTVFNLTALCTKENVKVGLLKESLYYYFQRENSLVHAFQSAELLKKADALLECAENYVSNPETKALLILEILKTLFAYRYGAMLEQESEIAKKNFARRYQKIRSMHGYQCISGKRRIIYSGFARFPYLYRCFRVWDDRTLLQWEREKKNAGKCYGK